MVWSTLGTWWGWGEDRSFLQPQIIASSGVNGLGKYLFVIQINKNITCYGAKSNEQEYNMYYCAIMMRTYVLRRKKFKCEVAW